MEVSAADKLRMLISACLGCFGLAAFSAVREVKGFAAEFGKLDLFMFRRVLHHSDTGLLDARRKFLAKSPPLSNAANFGEAENVDAE